MGHPSHSAIRIERHTPGSSSLGPELKALFDRAEAQHPQFGLDWLCNLADTALADGEEAWIFSASNGDGAVAALPLVLGQGGRRGRALANFYTSLYSPLVSAPQAGRLLAELFRHLARERKLTDLVLGPLDVEAATFPLLRDALVEAGWRGVHPYFCFGNWFHDLGGASWREYLGSRPSRVRNTVARRTRKFLNDAGGSLRLVRGGEELEAAIDDFTAVYNRSWKRPEPFPDFMPGLLRLAAARGWLRLGIATCEGGPVAAQAWLVSGGTAYIFKLAYHRDFARLSPGTVLTAFMLEQAVDRDRVGRIDYLSGDDAYKEDWMSARRERQGLAAYNCGTAAGLARYLAHRAAVPLKRARDGLRGGR